MLEEKELIAQLKKGDQSAFKKVYELYSEKVYNTAIGYIQNEAGAEEISQEVFISVFRNISKFREEASFSTWIYRITINTSLNHVAKKKRFSFFKLGQSEEEKPDFDHPGILLENKEEAKLLFKVIDTLPDKQKTAFILSFVEHLPRQEVADIMEMSLKAIESLLQRAKGNLRKKLENHYPNRRKSKK